DSGSFGDGGKRRERANHNNSMQNVLPLVPIKVRRYCQDGGVRAERGPAGARADAGPQDGLRVPA
ncbi:unnamed protein product, partial [Heterosigma akashiwo]